MTITVKPSNFDVSLRTNDSRATSLFFKPCAPDIVATPKAEREFTVSLIDDDAGVLRSLARLVRASGYVARTFSSAQQFLAQHDAAIPGCIVVDLLMPGVDGRQLQLALRKEDPDRPIIFISGTTDAPTIVDAMKAGAVDFLIKPVTGDALLAAIQAAAERQAKAHQKQAELACIKNKLDQLTPRESEVLRHVISGRLNKQIAWDLGTVEKTIKVHRSRIMEKMGVRTIAELVRLTEQIGLAPCESGDRQNKNRPEIFLGVGPLSDRLFRLASGVSLSP
jgi:FixJ family two-component response regulator